MKTIRYTPDAADKLRELKKVVAQEYGVPTSKRIIKSITDAIRGLCEFEKKGPEVSKMFNVDTDYRYIFVSRNYVFYKIEEKHIKIINIYHEREDFMMHLFGISELLQEPADK